MVNQTLRDEGAFGALHLPDEGAPIGPNAFDESRIPDEAQAEVVGFRIFEQPVRLGRLQVEHLPEKSLALIAGDAVRTSDLKVFVGAQRQHRIRVTDYQGITHLPHQLSNNRSNGVMGVLCFARRERRPMGIGEN